MSKFHHIGLSVKDFEKTVQFYKEVLGLKERCAFTTGDGRSATMLWLADGGIIEIFSGGTDADEVKPRWGHLAIGVDDVPGIFKKAVEFGAKPAIEPTKMAIPSDPPLDVELAFVYGVGGEYLEFFKEV